MALQTAQVSLSTSPVEITDHTTDTATASEALGGTQITELFASTITFRATVDAYLGASGVTSSTGFLLKAGESIAIDAYRSDRVYVVLASGTGTGYVLRAGV